MIAVPLPPTPRPDLKAIQLPRFEAVTVALPLARVLTRAGDLQELAVHPAPGAHQLPGCRQGVALIELRVGDIGNRIGRNAVAENSNSETNAPWPQRSESGSRHRRNSGGAATVRPRVRLGFVGVTLAGFASSRAPALGTHDFTKLLLRR